MTAVHGRCPGRQLGEFGGRQGALRQWSMLWFASLVPSFLYERFFARSSQEDPAVSGFSYYVENPIPVRDLGGARVRYVFGFGPTLTPPGWNPAFSKFGKSMNVSLTYTLPAVEERLAERYLDLIEAEAMGMAAQETPLAAAMAPSP